ncbi:secretory carrier-associated membrane protein 1-like [Histomonas meleagridis]|uniref:secretory carrier-associated membrane protein 1-like n=1 Tax=Histomonas meleagridis TaxID=135588 RepID=UPI003559D8AE|nr:secretory carrier-associated membrane protein 1-like [Histomonas meleagridis]KAH0803612.1 secretory carrier-associated membrane protein 1-like [Histomonas meleagridis]
MADPAARYYAIQQKEEELKRREKALKKANVEIEEDTHPPNFPPFCSVVYHNIAEEIPIASQWTIRIAFIMILALAVLVIINLIACCTTGTIKLGGSGASYSVGANIVFGVIIGILSVPLAFKINYYKLYTQAKTNNITLGWFALQAIFILCFGYAAVGLKNNGVIGIITMLDALAAGSGFCKVICIISAVLWVLGTLVEIFLFGRVMVLYKGSGAPQPSVA